MVAAFLLRLPLRQYTATGYSLFRRESAEALKCSSSLTFRLRLPGIWPSLYSARVRTSNRCTSGWAISASNSSTLIDLKSLFDWHANKVMAMKLMIEKSAFIVFIFFRTHHGVSLQGYIFKVVI